MPTISFLSLFLSCSHCFSPLSLVFSPSHFSLGCLLTCCWSAFGSIIFHWNQSWASVYMDPTKVQYASARQANNQLLLCDLKKISKANKTFRQSFLNWILFVLFFSTSLLRVYICFSWLYFSLFFLHSFVLIWSRLPHLRFIYNSSNVIAWRDKA